MATGLLRAAVAGALLLAALPGTASADAVNFSAQLASEADSRTTAAAARGAAIVSLDPATRNVHWRIEYSGLSQPPPASVAAN
jgi:CHRD domain-containing protein